MEKSIFDSAATIVPLSTTRLLTSNPLTNDVTHHEVVFKRNSLGLLVDLGYSTNTMRVTRNALLQK